MAGGFPGVRGADQPPIIRRPAMAVLGWVEAGAARGLDRRELLAGTGLSLSDVQRFDLTIEPWQELAVVRHLALAVPDHAGLGVQAASTFTLGSMGAVGLAYMSMHTVGEVMHHAVQLSELTFTLVQPVLAWSGHDLVITMSADHVPPSIAELIIERDLAACVPGIEALVVNPSGISIQTTLPPESVAALRSISHRITVRGGAQDSITFPERVWTAPTRQANPVVAAEWLARAQADLQRRQLQVSTASRVRATVSRRLADLPSAAELASALNMDERTLRRHLSREESSYRAIVDDARHAAALDLLRSTRLNMEQIAEQIGYRAGSAFIAAFKRWEGESPGRFRERTWDAD